MSVLVVGGAGFIGSHAVKALIARGYEVVVIDNLNTGHKAAVDQAAVFYELDIRDKAAVTEVFQRHQFDGVFHFAALSLVGESVEKPLAYFNNNVYGMQVLLEVMTENGVDKIIFSSTAAVYGDVAQALIDEASPANPASPYGESKLMMEKIIHWCAQVHNIRYVSLRYFNVAGASQDGSIGEDHRPETHLIPIVLQTALGQRQQLTIYGDDYETPDGTCIRDYVHVEDLIDAHILAYEYIQAGEPSQIFNLGSSQGYSVKEIWQAASEVVGREIPFVVGERRPGDPAKLVAASSKARELLQWKPRYDSIDTIIQTAWNWFQAHPAGYEE